MKKQIFTIINFFILVLAFSTLSLAFSPISTPLYNGIDVSEWQGEINYSQVAQDNIQIVYIKCSEGTNYIDPYFRTNYQKAKENNLKVGFYHFLTARTTDEAISEANFFVSVIKGLSPDCRLAMDFEQFGNLNIEEINNISKAFLEEVERLSNKEVIIYSDAFNAANTFSKSLANQYPVWVADYFVEEPSNGNWENWTGFQYTDRGMVSGINGYVDKDYFAKEILLSEISNIPDDTTQNDSSDNNTQNNSQDTTNNTLDTIKPPTQDNEQNTNQNTEFVIVKSGCTLSQIAIKYYTSYCYLAKTNNISNPNLIFVGQKIYVPTLSTSLKYDMNHRLYIVQPGDTLTYISELYNIPITTIIELNRIKNPNLIFAGQILRIN